MTRSSSQLIAWKFNQVPRVSHHSDSGLRGNLRGGYRPHASGPSAGTQRSNEHRLRHSRKCCDGLKGISNSLHFRRLLQTVRALGQASKSACRRSSRASSKYRTTNLAVFSLAVSYADCSLDPNQLQSHMSVKRACSRQLSSEN